MKRLVALAAVVLAVAALVWAALREESVSVETAAVARGDVAVVLRDEGRTRVRERYLVAAPLDGLLHRVSLDAGDDVPAGAALARIEPLAPALLDARALALADARLAAAGAAVLAAQERLAAAGVLLGAAQEDLDRRVRGGDAVSAQVVADARREVLFHAGEVSGARAAVAVAEAERAVARAALVAMRGDAHVEDGSGAEGAAPDAAATLVLRAPIDGRVLAVERESAGPVRIGDPLLTLADVRELEVVADFLTSEAVRMRPGMEARAVGWGGGAPLAARVRRVEPAARTKVSALGVEEQRVDVVLDLVDPRVPELSLGDGFRVQVEVVEARAVAALLVPEAALVRTGDAWSVFVVEGARAASREVALGKRDGRFAEVTGGLAEGEEVVLFPSDRVRDGARLARR